MARIIFTTPGRPIASISNVMLEYQAAPARKAPAKKTPAKKTPAKGTTKKP